MACPAHAQDTPVAPTGKWSVAFEDTMCVLTRDYGTLNWSLSRTPGDPRLEMVLTRPVTGKPRYRQGQGSVTLVPVGVTAKASFRETVVPTTSLFATQIIVDRGELSRLGEAGSLSIRLKSDHEIRLAVPGIANALRTLEGCEDDLMRRWGFDPQVQRALSRPAKRTAELFPTGRDNAVPIFVGRGGTVRARWTVGVDGRVSDCIIVISNADPVIDAMSCTLVKNMRYRPALDREGKPVETLDSNSFIWLPGD